MMRYRVTFYFDYAQMHRSLEATCVADAIHKAGARLERLGIRYNAVVATVSGE